MAANEATVETLIGSGPVLLTIDQQGIGILTLNTPQVANCLNNEMLIALREALMICHGLSRLRVLVLKGAGKNFCAGGDIKTFTAQGDNLPFYIRQATQYLSSVVNAFIRLQVPVIASVQGFAAGGGGFGFVCAADIVIASDDAKFLAGATRVGMAPDAGLSVTLTNLVGFRQAMHILLTNPEIDAGRALDLGILTQVVAKEALESETNRYAQVLAASPPQALGQTKRLLWNGIGSKIEPAFDDESRTVSLLSGTSDSMEAMHAVLEKRKPEFTGK